MIITGALILLVAAVIFFYMRQPQFGRTPSGERLARIERSQPYRVATPMIGEVVYLNNPSQSFKDWWKGVK